MQRRKGELLAARNPLALQRPIEVLREAEVKEDYVPPVRGRIACRFQALLDVGDVPLVVAEPRDLIPNLEPRS